MALTKIKTGGITDSAVTTAKINDDAVTDAKVADAITVTGAQTGITQTGTLTSFASTGIDDNATSTAITIDSSENVGIGVTSPSAGAVGGRVLHLVNSGGTASVRVDRSDASTAGTLSITSGNGSNSIFCTGNKSLNIHTNSTTRMTVDGSGNVGIGTTNPVSVLDLGSATEGEGIAWGGASGTAHYATIWTEYGNGSLIMGAGLKGSTSASTFLNPHTGTYGYSAIELDSFSDDGIKFYVGADSSKTKDASITPSEAMRIDSSGNVGIDQTSPSSFYSGASNLVIGNTSQAESGLTIVSSGGASSYGEIFFADGTTGNQAYRGFIQYNHDNSTDSLLFGTAGSERMRVDSSGNVLIGRTSVGTTGNGHSIRGADSAIFSRDGGEAVIMNRDSSDGLVLEFRRNGSTSVGKITALGSERIAIHSGTVGIEFNPSNQVNPSNGSGGLDNTLDLGASTSRWDDIYATNTTIQSSDERMKDEIIDSPIGLSFINDLRPVQYKWKDYDDKTFSRKHYGLIAQEVEQVLSDNDINTNDFAPLVYDEESDRYGMRYGEMVGILIKAVQELSAKVEALENA